VTGAVQHHCDIQTHSISSSLLDTITHLTPGTQPRQEPRQPDLATYRQPGNPATRQPGNPAAPGSTRQHLEVPPHRLSLAAPGSTREHPAAPGSTRSTRQQTSYRIAADPAADPANPAPGSTWQAATRQTPGNPTRQHPATRQPGLNLRVSCRCPARAKAGKTASALRIADLWSTGFTCSSSSTTWNDVPFELKHRARLGAARATRMTSLPVGKWSCPRTTSCWPQACLLSRSPIPTRALRACTLGDTAGTQKKRTGRVRREDRLFFLQNLSFFPPCLTMSYHQSCLTMSYHVF